MGSPEERASEWDLNEASFAFLLEDGSNQIKTPFLDSFLQSRISTGFSARPFAVFIFLAY